MMTGVRFSKMFWGERPSGRGGISTHLQANHPNMEARSGQRVEWRDDRGGC